MIHLFINRGKGAKSFQSDYVGTTLHMETRALLLTRSFALYALEFNAAVVQKYTSTNGIQESTK